MYSNLKAELSRANVTSAEVAKAIGMTRQGFYSKKNGINDWKLSQMVALQDYINKKLNTNYTLDYLFKRD